MKLRQNVLVSLSMTALLLAGCSSSAPSSSAPVINATTTTVSTAPNPSTTVRAVTLTASVASSGAPATNATGTVQFYSNGTALGSPVTLSNGAAVLSNTCTTAATYTITASYSGDSSFAASTSSAASLVVSTYTPPVGNYVGAAFSGVVLAGNTPVIGATVQLLAAGSTGNGSAPTELLPTLLTTDSNGAFRITTAYTCPYNISVLYVVATGGHAGASGITNPGTVLMSSPGLCDTVTNTTSVTLNEATTVAGAFAFAPFLAAGGQIGATSTNSNSPTSGLQLAAGSMANLVNPSLGTSPGAAFPTNGVAPTAKIYSLANILNACITSTGPSSAACTGLYAAATVSGSAAPTNTLDAIANIAHHPGTNIATLYTLSSGSSVFAPKLTAQPSDWMLFLNFTGGGMNAPSAVNVDSTGRVWVANYFDVASLFSNTGVPAFSQGVTGNYLNESYGAAIDANDDAWFANEQNAYGNGLGSITVLNPTGQSAAGPYGYSSGGLSFPIAIAVDTADVSWIVNYGNSTITLLSNTGTALSGASGYNGVVGNTGNFYFPVAVAVDSKRNGYVANSGANTVVKISADGSSITSITCCNGSSGVAVDGSDNVWVADYYGNDVALISSAGKLLSGSGYTGGGIDHPQGIAVDGAGTAWVANYRPVTTGPDALTQLAAASTANPGAILSPSTGWGLDADMLEAFGIAIDAAGNVWVSSFGNNMLTEFVGIAAPVKTPLLGPVRVP